jgi:hypothetical protein
VCVSPGMSRPFVGVPIYLELHLVITPLPRYSGPMTRDDATLGTTRWEVLLDTWTPC